MPTQLEEQQAAEFLKRAEIKTMRKDLAALREADALKERDKIAKLKTLEEQLEEKIKADKATALSSATAEAERLQRQETLTKQENEEKDAEKDLKQYATEQERQQIFLFESQRLQLEEQFDAIDKQKDPSLKLEKNGLLLKVRTAQEKLDEILKQEKILEDEQKLVSEKEQSTAIAVEKKTLEQTRWDIDAKIQEIEKKRWEAEKQIQDTEDRVKQIDITLEQNSAEKNKIRDQILGIEKSLREVYFVIMAREDEKRRNKAQEQIKAREDLAKAKSQQMEETQRQQWTGLSLKKEKVFLKKTPESVRQELAKTAKIEQEQRKQFIQDVEGLLPPVPKKGEIN